MHKWPKAMKILSEKEEIARDTFMKLWHETLPKKYGVIEKFNHCYPQRSKKKTRERILEIGAGLGEHIHYEVPDWKEYCCVEMRPEMAEVIVNKYGSGVKVVVQDCQKAMPFENDYFDRVLAIHVLEHLPNLPACIKEVWRVLKKRDGLFTICIPCEGGLAYRIARGISAKRVFQEHFPDLDYEKVVVTNEHINLPAEIIAETGKLFHTVAKRFFPLIVPWTNLNLVIGMSFTPKKPLG